MSLRPRTVNPFAPETQGVVCWRSIHVGKNLNKAQEAFETAQKHLKTYRGRVTVLSGQEQLDLDAANAAAAANNGEEAVLPLIDKASA